MANVDLTLRITNPSVFKQLETWSTTGMKVKIDLTPSFNATAFKQQVQQALGSIAVTIDPKLGNPKQLARDIQNAIGGQVFNINVSIGNLAALNAQIASIFAGLGIQVGGTTPPQRQGRINTGTPLQRVYRTMAGMQGTLIANEQTPINNPSVAFLEQQLAAGAAQGGIPGFFDRATQARLERAREQAQMKARKRQAFNRQFRESRLLEIGLDGPTQAAADFEESAGLRPGDINTRGINRFSFDLGRLKNVKAATSLGYTGLLGGPAGFLGGLIGGGLFGAGGVSPVSFAFQAIGIAIKEKIAQITEALKKASEAGLEFEKNILGVQAILTTTSKVVRGGKDVGIAESIAFRRTQAEDLLRGTRSELSPLGINQGQQAAILRGVISGASEGGFNLDKKQTIRLARLIGGTTAVSNEDLLSNTPRLVNDIADLLAASPTSGRSELGQQFRQILPEIKAAQASGDTERLIKALEKYNDVVKTLELSTNSAAVAFRKYDAINQQLVTTFGEAFNKALVPGLNSINKALSNKNIEESLTKIGEALGEMGSALAQIHASNLTALIYFIKDVLALENVKKNGIDTPFLKTFGENQSPISTGLSNALGVVPGFQNPGLRFGLQQFEGILRLLRGPSLGSIGAAVSGASELTGGLETKPLADQNFDRFITKFISDLDPNNKEDILLSKEADLAKGLRSGSISRRVYDLQIERARKQFGRNNQLAGLDQGTRAGRFQAQQLSLQGQLDDGLINQDVFNAQTSRNSELFDISEQLGGINSQSVGGGLMSGLLGIKQRVVSGDISGGVGKEQGGKLFRGTVIKVVEDFNTLTKSVQDASFALSEIPTKFKELGIQLDMAKKQQADLAQSQYLNSLTGVDKALAMEEQLRSVGIIPDVRASNKLNDLGGYGLDYFSGFDKPEDRKNKILQQQYIAYVNQLGLEPGKAKLEKSALDSKVKELSLAKSQFAPGAVQENLAKIGLSKQLVTFAEEFGLEQAEKQFGKDKLDDAFKFLGKESAPLIGLKGQTKDVAAMIKETFGSNYFVDIKSSFKGALEEVFN